MKMKITITTLLLMITIALAGCEKSGTDNNYKPSDKALENFNEMYPDAQNVKWNVSETYSTARFNLPAITGYSSDFVNAKYENQTGEWAMTRFDILYEDLPEAVRKTFQSSDYATWRIDDIERWEYSGNEIKFMIEVEKKDVEVEMLYAENGELISVEADSDIDEEDYLPGENPSIEKAIDLLYPGAEIREIEVEKDFIIVEIIYSRTEKEVYFTSDYVWVRTETDIRYKELPEKVRAALNKGIYASWEIEDVELWEQADKTVLYMIEVESYDIEYNLFYTADGTLIKAEDEKGNSVDDGQKPGNGSSYQIVEEFIARNYPGARIIEIETEDGEIVAEIRHEHRDKDVHFTCESVWTYTESEMRYKELPAPVKATVEAEYPKGKVEDADLIEMPEIIYYEIEIEMYDNDFELRILPDGTLMK